MIEKLLGERIPHDVAQEILRLKAQNEKYRKALEKIRTYPHPTFNGERVWTVSDISMPTKIAEEAIKGE